MRSVLISRTFLSPRKLAQALCRVLHTIDALARVRAVVCFNHRKQIVERGAIQFGSNWLPECGVAGSALEQSDRLSAIRRVGVLADSTGR
jgi:hypothetical protein